MHDQTFVWSVYFKIYLLKYDNQIGEIPKAIVRGPIFSTITRGLYAYNAGLLNNDIKAIAFSYCRRREFSKLHKLDRGTIEFIVHLTNDTCTKYWILVWRRINEGKYISLLKTSTSAMIQSKIALPTRQTSGKRGNHMSTLRTMRYDESDNLLQRFVWGV